MKKRHTAVMAAVLLLVGGAQADLIDTTMDLTLEQSGMAGELAGPTGGEHMYGYTSTFWLLSGPTWDVVSPAGVSGYDNSMVLNFTNFQYASYAVLGPSTSTLDIEDIAEDVEAGSAAVFLPGDPNTDIKQFAVESGKSLSIGWDVQTVVNHNPVNPSVMVAWNSMPVPGPGALVLLGVAGVMPLVGGRRRA